MNTLSHHHTLTIEVDDESTLLSPASPSPPPSPRSPPTPPVQIPLEAPKLAQFSISRKEEPKGKKILSFFRDYNFAHRFSLKLLFKPIKQLSIHVILALLLLSLTCFQSLQFLPLTSSYFLFQSRSIVNNNNNNNKTMMMMMMNQTKAMS